MWQKSHVPQIGVWILTAITTKRILWILAYSVPDARSRNKTVLYREKDAMAFGGTNNTIKKNTYTKEYLSNHIVSEADVMKQIGYEPQMHDDFIENIALLMAEVFNMPDDAILKINQIELSARIVKERFRKVRYKHLEYIKLVFQDFTGEITSMKNYMLTTIYNAPATCDIYFTHRVNRDQYKDSSHQIA